MVEPRSGTPHLSPRKNCGPWLVARGSWLVARKSLPAYSNWLWSNLAGGLPTRKPLRSLDGAIYYESKASRAVHFWFITATVHPHRLYAIP